MSYKTEVEKAMCWLGKKNTLFIGQTVISGGSFMSDTLKSVPMEKKIEFPVAEEMQMGVGIGMALTQKVVPILVYPRIDFLLLAINQLSNHLDILKEMTYGEWEAKVIIRTAIGAKDRFPLPGIQHSRDHTEVFKSILKTTPVIKLSKADDVMPIYKDAYEREGSSLIIEMAENY